MADSKRKSSPKKSLRVAGEASTENELARREAVARCDIVFVARLSRAILMTRTEIAAPSEIDETTRCRTADAARASDLTSGPPPFPSAAITRTAART